MRYAAQAAIFLALLCGGAGAEADTVGTVASEVPDQIGVFVVRPTGVRALQPGDIVGILHESESMGEATVLKVSETAVRISLRGVYDCHPGDTVVFLRSPRPAAAPSFPAAPGRAAAAAPVTVVYREPGTISRYGRPPSSSGELEPDPFAGTGHSFAADVGNLRLLKRIGRWQPTTRLSTRGLDPIPSGGAESHPTVSDVGKAETIIRRTIELLGERYGMRLQLPLIVEYVPGGRQAMRDIGDAGGMASMAGTSNFIEIVGDIPADEFTGTFAHEFGHCWYNETSAITNSAQLWEGFPSWIQFKALLANGYRSQAAWVATRTHPVYARYNEGFRICRGIEQEHGELGVMLYLYTGSAEGKLPAGVTLPGWNPGQ